MADFSNFSTDKICELFSRERISSYDSVNQHFENFALIGSIAENIGIAEVLLRNKIDSVMSAIDSLWLFGKCEVILKATKSQERFLL